MEVGAETTRTERMQQVERLVQAALNCAAAERADFISEACGADPSLISEVEARLSSYLSTEAALNLEEPTQSLADAITISISEEEQSDLFKEPDIGQYKLIRR